MKRGVQSFSQSHWRQGFSGIFSPLQHRCRHRGRSRGSRGSQSSPDQSKQDDAPPNFKDVLYSDRFQAPSSTGKKSGLGAMFSTQSNQAGQTGLFGKPNMRQAKDLYTLREEAETKCRQLVEQIKQRPINDIHHTLNLIDEISNQLCLFLDCVELVRQVHPSEEWRAAANETWQSFHSYLHHLNTDVGIHDTLRDIISMSESPEHDQQFSSAEAHVAEHLKIDMEKNGGVKDSTLDGDHIRALKERLDILSQEFYMAHHKSKESYPLTLTPTEIKEHVLGLPYKMSKAKRSGNNAILSTHDANLLLSVSSEPSIREKAFLAVRSGTPDSLQALHNLLDARNEMAQYLGYESFADWSVEANILNSPPDIKKLLDATHEQASSKIEMEMDFIRSLKQKEEGRSSDAQVWDRMYYTRKATDICKSDFKIDDYFPLHKCLEGFYMVCQKMFNIKLEPTPLKEGEGWDPEVRKLEVIHPEKGVLGFIYLDLHYRPNKTQTCANFSVQVGKEKNQQKPIAVIICDFYPQHGEISTLNYSEVLALFHELGHALHVVLGSGDFQTTSGTRTEIDFVEMPSQLMEHFLYDYRVVSMFAQHYKTGEVLPESVFNQTLESRKLFSGLRLEDTILISQLDLALHGKRDASYNPTQINEKMTEQYSAFPVVPQLNDHANVFHLLNYAAGYYSYLFCKVCSHHIYHKYFSENPFNQEAGMKYIELLEKVGKVNSKQAIVDFLGEEPDPQHLIEGLYPPTREGEGIYEEILRKSDEL